MKKLITTLLLTFFIAKSQAAKIPCQKEAEDYAIKLSVEKANLPKSLMSTAHPTELDEGKLVVYIGARAGYNYFKMKFSKKCKFEKMLEVEYIK